MKKLSDLKFSRKNTIALLENPDLSMLEKIENLEKVMGFDPVSIDLAAKHYFGKNVYVREMRIKAGTFFTGAVHKEDHVLTLVTGDLLQWDYHRGVNRFVGYRTVESRAGVKRAAIALTDVLLTTAHYVDSAITSVTARDALTFPTRALFLEDRRQRLIDEGKSITRDERQDSFVEAPQLTLWKS